MILFDNNRPHPKTEEGSVVILLSLTLPRARGGVAPSVVQVSRIRTAVKLTQSTCTLDD